MTDRHLAQLNPGTEPTVADAVAQLDRLRADGPSDERLPFSDLRTRIDAPAP